MSSTMKQGKQHDSLRSRDLRLRKALNMKVAMVVTKRMPLSEQLKKKIAGTGHQATTVRRSMDLNLVEN